MLRLEPARLVWTFHKMTKGKWVLFQFLCFQVKIIGSNILFACQSKNRHVLYIYMRVGLHGIQGYMLYIYIWKDEFMNKVVQKFESIE